jgi:hypothetical protein
MQQIEVAVGERNPFAGTSPFLYALAQLFPSQNFVVCFQMCVFIPQFQ